MNYVLDVVLELASSKRLGKDISSIVLGRNELSVNVFVAKMISDEMILDIDVFGP